MIMISAQREVGPMLITEDSAKDLFICMLERHLSSKEEDIELDFSSVVTIGNDFFEHFLRLAGKSDVFNVGMLKDRVVFSGLYLRDIQKLTEGLTAYVMLPEIDSKVKEVRDTLNKAKSKNFNNAGVNEAFEKISKVLEGALGNLGKNK